MTADQRQYLDIHVLQTVPPSCVNRDDTGSPKTALFGGVQRARVSSQSWKRATRLMFDATTDDGALGIRTKRIVELVAEQVKALDESLSDDADQLATDVLLAGKIKVAAPRKGGVAESGYLIFVSRAQVRALAEEAVASHQENRKPDPKVVKAAIQRYNSLDLALFGRMVAEDTSLNVNAAVQVAHALSVHAVQAEYDYFTAVDDLKSRSQEEEDSGAGMIGTVEFNSSTLYRYATVNLAMLEHNLGDQEAVALAVRQFISCFVQSMPTGKQNTFANRTLPDALCVSLRSGQPVSLVGAFERAIPATNDGYLGQAVQRLVRHAQEVDLAYDSSPTQVWTLGVGEAAASLDDLSARTSMPALLDGVTAALRTPAGEQT